MDRLANAVENLPEGAVIAVDGRCGAGKTTLAAKLCEKYGARAVHMDDFFLPPPLRTKERLAQPGGNVHYERFLSELAPQLKSPVLEYRAFDCACGVFEKRRLGRARFTVVEGSYSLHPKLFALYDLRIFLDIPKAVQAERILAREGDGAAAFFEKWIPLEEKYFSVFGIGDRCDLKIGGIEC